MDFISLLVVEPTGMWQSIISFFESFILNYAWAIIVLTICIKIILTPLDFLNKKVARDNSRMQEVVGPELKKLQKQYANDRMKLNQKTQELYKNSGYNMMGSCWIMLLNLALTLVIFITLFSALHSMSGYKIEQQYLQLKQEYNSVYELKMAELQNEEIDETQKEAQATEAGQTAVLALYDEIQNGFIWVKNIWVSDNPWTEAILPFDSYIQAVGGNIRLNLDDTENIQISKMGEEEKQLFLEAFEEEYNAVMGILIDEKGGANGYLITALFAILTCFFSQYLMQRRNKTKKVAVQNSPAETQAQSNKLLLIILPVIMGIFTLFYNAIFGLYIIASQIVSLATFPLIDKLLDIYYNNKDKKQAQKIKMDYSRK